MCIRDSLNTVPGMRMLVAQMDVIFKFLFNQTVTGADKQACIEMCIRDSHYCGQ